MAGLWKSEHNRRYEQQYLLNKPSLRKQRSITHYRLVMMLGGECVKCGYRDPRALQIDHINGKSNNKEERTYNKYYLDHPDETNKKFQVLCANCNWIKRYENKEVFIHEVLKS